MRELLINSYTKNGERERRRKKESKNYCMKGRDSERKGSCIKRRKEKKHAQIKELTD
jgi:hypothetical protein